MHALTENAGLILAVAVALAATFAFAVFTRRVWPTQDRIIRIILVGFWVMLVGFSAVIIYAISTYVHDPM